MDGIRWEHTVDPYATAKTQPNELEEIREEFKFRYANIAKTLRQKPELANDKAVEKP